MHKESHCEFDLLSKWLLKQLPYLPFDLVEQYVNKLIKDGWNVVDFIEEELDDEKCLHFMLAPHKHDLLQRLKEIRERRADGQEPTGTPVISSSQNGSVDGVEVKSPAAADNDLERYMYLLKYDRNGKEALTTYHEWSDSGHLLELAKKRLDDVMAQIDSTELADLLNRFPIRQYGLDLVMKFLTPMRARQNPKGQLKRPSPGISSSDDSGKSDDKKFDINLGSATHLSNRIIQGAYQTTKTKLIAFTIIMASAFMVPTVVITKKVSLSSDLKSTIQRIVRELLGDTGTFADNNFFCITKKDKSLNNYKCMEEGFCPKAISWEGAVMVIGGSDNQVGKVREMIEYIKLEHYCIWVFDEYDIIAGQGTNIPASGELHELLKHQHLGVIGITPVPVPSLILKSKIV